MNGCLGWFLLLLLLMMVMMVMMMEIRVLNLKNTQNKEGRGAEFQKEQISVFLRNESFFLDGPPPKPSSPPLCLAVDLPDTL